MREPADVYELLEDPHFAVPVAILLLSLAALALILYLQERGKEVKPTNGETTPTTPLSSGGTVFVEDDEGHTVRRSQRERKSVARFAPDNNYQVPEPTTPTSKVSEHTELCMGMSHLNPHQEEESLEGMSSSLEHLLQHATVFTICAQCKVLLRILTGVLFIHHTLALIHCMPLFCKVGSVPTNNAQRGEVAFYRSIA